MPDPAAKPQRRWFQFSLRTLLIFIAAAAGLAFGWLKTIEPYRFQREAMAAITRLGGTYKTEDATGWVRYLDKNAQDVVVVDLADCDKPDEYLPHLVRLPRLRTLVVGGHSVGDEQVAALRRVASMRGLVLDSTRATDEGVEMFNTALPDLIVYKSQRRASQEFRKLGATVLEDTDRLDDRLPLCLAPVPHAVLRGEADDKYFCDPAVSVSFDGRHVTDADLRWLVNLTDVRSISLDGTLIAGECFANAVSSSLDYLTLAGTQVNDRTVQHIARCTNLRVLDLTGTHVTDNGASYLATLSKLEYLRLADTRITDAGIRSVAKLRQLKSVAAPTAMGDQGLAALADLPVLEELFLPDCNVSDEGLEPLRHIKNLERLWCGSKRITDNGVPHLEACKGLAQLTIVGTRVSASGVRRLKKALPTCDIDKDGVPFAR